MNDDKVIKNLQSSIYWVSGSNILAAILFLVAYAALKIIWLLVISVLSFIAGIVIIFVIFRIQNKYLRQNNINNQKQN
jgi:hypothetical protein